MISTSATSLVAGIAYRVDLVDKGGRHPRFDVTVGAIEEITPASAKLQFIHSLRFDLPPTDRFVGALPGASEVFGLLGGVPDEYQRACSEQVERALGDLITSAVCNLVDGYSSAEHELVVAILGPPLPKVVGRLLSIRAPARVGLSWVCPVPLPPCVGDELLEFSARSVKPPSVEASAGDERQSLLSAASANRLAGQECWLYALDTYGTGSKATDCLLATPWKAWCGERSSVQLPRQLVLAIDIVCQRASYEPRSPGHVGDWSAVDLDTASQIARLSAAARTGPQVFAWL